MVAAGEKEGGEEEKPRWWNRGTTRPSLVKDLISAQWAEEEQAESQRAADAENKKAGKAKGGEDEAR